MRTMKAAVVRNFGQPLSIEELPIPTPGAGEVLVKMMATGVCHTDLHAADGDWPARPRLPFIPGHEGAGVIAAVGAGVTELKEGDAVGIAWLHDACGACELLHQRLGNPVLAAAQQRLQRQWDFCGIRDRSGSLRRASSRAAGFRRARSNSLCGCDHLQRHQGNRSATW